MRLSTLKPYYETKLGKLYHGDALDVLNSMEPESIQTCITSPPYWGLRSYLPDTVTPKDGIPEWVFDELKGLGIFPIDNT